MTSTFTNNFELVKQGAGDNVDTWGDPVLNAQMIQRVDDALGKTTTVALSASPVTLTQTQWRSKALLLTGTISADITISLPLSVNSVGSATAVGGEFIVDNQTTGAFKITINTAATASTGVQVPQGLRSVLYSDTVDVMYSDDQSLSTVLTYPGNPNGNVAGTAGSVNTPASVIFDRSNQIYYICTTTGDATAAVWTAISGQIQSPQGYLTASSSADNVVLTGDSIGATRLYYTPYIGAYVPIFNGVSFVPFVFSQLTLDLTASQSANGIYDVILFLNSGVLTIGFGPSWSAGTGGSVTAGSCVRGTGVGGAAIQRVGGVWVNTAAMNLNNGATTYSIAAQRGTVIGSVSVDSTQGQVTCRRTWGQSRKWGVWNFYNRLPIILQAGDSTPNWVYGNATIRQSNAAAGNTLAVFSGLAEEEAAIDFKQTVTITSSGGDVASIYIGVNSIVAASGTRGFIDCSSTNLTIGGTPTAAYTLLPSLGINNINSLEGSSNSSVTYFGTELNMLLRAQWRG